MVLALTCSWPTWADPADYFAIKIVDAESGRGVPLVELRTTNEIRFHTDSAGLVAINEPGLMDRNVFLFIASHGYKFPADGFGFRGTAVRMTRGGEAKIAITRINIAERLYRIIGQGIYRDTILLGRTAPIDAPVLNARVMGQDSIFNAFYKGELYWFWGDTTRESYPLGNFRMAGARSTLPGNGGLDPGIGVNLRYFVDDQGFGRSLAPFPEVKGGMYWLDGFMVLPDQTGRQRMVSHASHMESLTRRLDHKLAIYNDDEQVFEPLKPSEATEDLHPRGHSFEVTLEGQRYFYFASPHPLLRVRADWAALLDPQQFESFTCLQPGARYHGASSAVERDEHGRIVWAWKTNTSWVDQARQNELIAANRLTPDEAWIDTRDIKTRQPIALHGGSVAWNSYRQKWIMIAVQAMETSPLGEVWYAESDRPEGPWHWARKIATHSDYSFYNPKHHPYFDQDGGRIIYFEGTYADTFSGAKFATPRYNYNQIMYRLDLTDERLRLRE